MQVLKIITDDAFTKHGDWNYKYCTTKYGFSHYAVQIQLEVPFNLAIENLFYILCLYLQRQNFTQFENCVYNKISTQTNQKLTVILFMCVCSFKIQLENSVRK